MSSPLSGPLADPLAAVAAIRDRVAWLIEADATRIFEQAEERWPVRTGKSKRGLVLEDGRMGSLIVFRIRNTVDYARFIKSLKVGPKPGPDWRPVLTRELGDPVRAARRTLAPRAADVAASVLSGL